LVTKAHSMFPINFFSQKIIESHSLKNYSLQTTQCHSKGTSDFAFQGGSSSLFCTVGHSSDGKNVALWDTLMPQRRSLVESYNSTKVERLRSFLLHSIVSWWQLVKKAKLLFGISDNISNCTVLKPMTIRSNVWPWTLTRTFSLREVSMVISR